MSVRRIKALSSRLDRLRFGCRLSVVLTMALGLTACTSMSEATYKTLQAAFRAGKASSENLQDSGIDPAFKTMRVLTSESQAVLVLGEIEPSPDGDIEVWFSGRGEVIRIQNGRIVATAGLPVNWVRSHYQRLEGDAPDLQRWQVTRDRMPGWHYGQTTDLVETAISQPPTSVARWFDLRKLDSERSHWRIMRPNQSGDSRNTASDWQWAYFAVNARGQTRAGFQCLSPDLCLAWQKLR